MTARGGAEEGDAFSGIKQQLGVLKCVFVVKGFACTLLLRYYSVSTHFHVVRKASQ
jgi:hypothetical protein